MRSIVPPRHAISPDAPLRLSVAAPIAFPDGSMTASGLSREGARGRLIIERIAGKDYTTLANIERMRESCRVEAKALDFGSDPPRRKGRRVIANAVWIILDGKQHIATGCLAHQIGEAERCLADYVSSKYRPARHARDIAQIDIADVLSIYLDDCGARVVDQPKLERCIARLNNYWGGKMLSEITNEECRAYVRSRGKIGGARSDLAPLRAALSHHATPNFARVAL